jgi:hypothetical protein
MILRKHEILYTKSDSPSPELLAILADCERVSTRGGSFVIEHEFRSQWRTIITVYDPPPPES